MPTPRKPLDERVGHHAAPTELDTTGPGYDVPRAPMGLPASLRVRWQGIWTSPLAAVMDPVSDLPAMENLFRLYKLQFKYDLLIKMADPAKMSDAIESGDYSAANEMAAALKEFNATVGTRLKITAEIRQAEDRLGLSPRARLALGVVYRGAAGSQPDAGGIDDAQWGEYDDGSH